MPTRYSLTDFNGLRDSVVKLRCLGNSYTVIAKTLNISYKQVQTIIDSEFKDRFENREQLRLQTAMQYDFLIRPLLEKFDTTVDRRDAETIAKLLDNKARLLGLNEATKIEVKHKVEELTDEELEKELARHNVVIQVVPATDNALPEHLPTEDISDADFSTIPEKEAAPLIETETDGEISNRSD